jgi:hypothetical protein
LPTNSGNLDSDGEGGRGRSRSSLGHKKVSRAKEKKRKGLTRGGRVWTQTDEPAVLATRGVFGILVTGAVISSTSDSTMSELTGARFDRTGGSFCTREQPTLEFVQLVQRFMWGVAVTRLQTALFLKQRSHCERNELARR